MRRLRICDRLQTLRGGRSVQEVVDDINSYFGLSGKEAIKRETLRNWENGTRSIKAETILMLAEYYGVSTDYLLGTDENETKDSNLAGVCGYLNLSQDAVTNIKAAATAERKEALNSFFASREFDSFVAELQNAYIAYELIRVFIAALEALPVPPCAEDLDAYKKALNESPERLIKALEDKRRYSLFSLEESARDVMRSIYGDLTANSIRSIYYSRALAAQMLWPDEFGSDIADDYSRAIREYSEEGGTDDGEQ